MITIDLCFEIVSPIHIGYGKRDLNTAIAGTRAYIPGKTIWGAITASLAGKLFDKPEGKHFREVGEELQNVISFSYLFPADMDTDIPKMFILPFEISGTTEKESTDCEIIHSFNSTSISDGIAEDGSLHEIKYLRPQLGTNGVDVRSLYLVGKAYLNEQTKKFNVSGENIFYKGISLFDDIQLGGERNYGFGKIKQQASDSTFAEYFPFFEDRDSENNLIVKLNKTILPGHCRLLGNDVDKAIDWELLISWISGIPELLMERETNTHTGASSLVNKGYFLPPGSKVTDLPSFIMDPFGRLSLMME